MKSLPPNKTSEHQVYSDVERRTKEIYIAQHRNYTKDKSIFNRFLNVASDPAAYDLPKDFFSGKTVLDAGCGNTGYFQVAMIALGVAKISCLDLGIDWIPELKRVLEEYGVKQQSVDYIEGSTTKLPFDDESFDFVASNGVIMHLETLTESSLALKELSRVTKRGGCLYVYSGVDSPGIVDRYIVPALRKAYVEDEAFRHFVDNIDHQKITSELKQCFTTAQAFDQSISPDFIQAIQGLFTLDSSTFTQNILQVPVQQGPKMGFDWIKTQLESLGLKNIRRVKERYWVRNDYRKYLAPLHYYHETEISQLLYGNGHVKVICEK
jgi:ubiquinone/menaquinone biosynthesis C-methylase UbiE